MRLLCCLLVLLSIRGWCDENPTPEEHLKTIESNGAYKEVVAKGFTGKNQHLDVAILEVLATKELGPLGEKLSEEQLDLIGPVLAYSRKAGKLPEKLLAAMKKSSNLRYTIKQATAWELRAGEYVSYSCFTPGMDAVSVFPSDYDSTFSDGKVYSKVAILEKIDKGETKLLYLPKALLQDKRTKGVGSAFDSALAKHKPVNMVSNTAKANEIQSKMAAKKTKTVWMTIYPWNIRQHDKMAGNKGVVLNVWNSEEPGPPMIVRIPFKDFIKHAETFGWEGKYNPGCGGDEIQIIAEYKGKTTVTNKMGMLIEVAIVEAVAVNDGYSFYKK